MIGGRKACGQILRHAPPEMATQKQFQQEEMRLKMALLEDNERYLAARRSERERQLLEAGNAPANQAAAPQNPAPGEGSHAGRVEQSRATAPQRTV